MNNAFQRLLTGVLLGATALALYVYAPAWAISAVLAAVAATILVVEWPQFFDAESWDFWLVGGAYIVVPFGFMIYLNQLPQYHFLLAFALLLVAAHDTGSYVFGKLFGKHTIMPHISAGKTWQGFMGGVATAYTAFLFYCAYNHISVPWLTGVLLVAKISYIALIGDLFESWLKRSVGLKDSGTLLPGHGGLLDRFDALMFVIIYVFIMKDYLVTVLS